MWVLIAIVIVSAAVGWIATVAFNALLGSVFDVSLISSGLGFAITWAVFAVISFVVLTVLPFPSDLHPYRKRIRESLAHFDDEQSGEWGRDPQRTAAFIGIEAVPDKASLLHFAAADRFCIEADPGEGDAPDYSGFIAISRAWVPSPMAIIVVRILNEAMAAPFPRERLGRARKLLADSIPPRAQP